jgi:hypothetical protein
MHDYAKSVEYLTSCPKYVEYVEKLFITEHTYGENT